MLWSSLGSLGPLPRPARFTGLSVETGELLPHTSSAQQPRGFPRPPRVLQGQGPRVPSGVVRQVAGPCSWGGAVACSGAERAVAWQQPVPSCFSGAGQDVGRSCILVSIAGKNVMLDCGMHMGFNDDVSPEGRRPGGTSVSCSLLRFSAEPQASEPRSRDSGKVGSGGRQLGLGSLRSLAGPPHHLTDGGPRVEGLVCARAGSLGLPWS